MQDLCGRCADKFFDRLHRNDAGIPLYFKEFLCNMAEICKQMPRKGLCGNASGFAGAAENVYDLVLHHFFHHNARVAEILTGIEMIGMLREVLADCRRE